ncbi:beta-ketoacyl synthase, partial [Xenorhabdus bovienii]|nr:beta-ketoacyl synthase [Xenorhabdus bovienii]
MAAVPDVFVNADGIKKSITAPGAGNYITMTKAVSLAANITSKDSVRNRSCIIAHGSSTPQNRVTESQVFDYVAKAFRISNWKVTAPKA